MAEEWNGLLLLDKPEGPTSHDIVHRVRRATGQRRIGHGGTLDPMATGLLPLVLGRATRLVQYLPHSPKVYRGTLRLGLTTTTDDITGNTLTVSDGPLPEAEAVIEAGGALTGRLDQQAPTVSAKQVGGRRLYRLAREGKTVEAPTSVVEVERFELASTDLPEIYAFEAEVSAGTYIRALARDLGASLGCGGTLASLSRTRIGPMKVEDAVPCPDRDESAPALKDGLIPLERMPLDLAPVQLEQEDEVRRFTLGGILDLSSQGPEEGRYRVLGPSGELLGIADLTCGKLRPKVVIATPL